MKNKPSQFSIPSWPAKWPEPRREARACKRPEPRTHRLHWWARATLALVAGASLGWAQPVSLKVQVDRPGAALNRAMWGVFFEDINFGADGGLYGELVKNRGFEFRTQ